MIELFRHEAMNQATVVAGFCEIIENVLLKQSGAVSQEFLTVLHKVELLIRSFNQTFAVFREESMVSDQQQLSVDIDNIEVLLSHAGRIHFGVLCEITGGLSEIAGSIRGEDIDNGVVASRFLFVQEAASKLNVLFADPVTFMHKAASGERAIG